MADDYSYNPQVTNALWQQYANGAQNTPTGFQFNENQALANALYNYGQDPYLSPITYMPGYEDTLTRKLLEKNAAGTTTTQPATKQQSSMPNMNMMQGMMGGSGFAPSSASATPGTGAMDFSAPFGSTGGSMVNAGASSAPMGAGDFAGSSAAGSGGGGLMDFGSSFGSTGSSTVTPGTPAAGATGGGWMDTLGIGGGQGGLSYASAAGGALGGYMAGRENYKNDPNMWNQKDNFGTAHKDYRAEVGGGTLGGVMGYFGGPVGAALAGPTVKAVHPFMEKSTRGVINFGDKVGGAGGAMMLDPIGTAASGKYKWGDVIGGGLLGPAYNLFK